MTAYAGNIDVVRRHTGYHSLQASVGDIYYATAIAHYSTNILVYVFTTQALTWQVKILLANVTVLKR